MIQNGIFRKFRSKINDKRSWLVRALDASECILKNMLHTTVIIRLPMDSLKGLGPSGFDPMKKGAFFFQPLGLFRMPD